MTVPGALSANGSRFPAGLLLSCRFRFGCTGNGACWRTDIRKMAGRLTGSGDQLQISLPVSSIPSGIVLNAIFEPLGFVLAKMAADRASRRPFFPYPDEPVYRFACSRFLASGCTVAYLRFASDFCVLYTLQAPFPSLSPCSSSVYSAQAARIRQLTALWCLKRPNTSVRGSMEVMGHYLPAQDKAGLRMRSGLRTSLGKTGAIPNNTVARLLQQDRYERYGEVHAATPEEVQGSGGDC